MDLKKLSLIQYSLELEKKLRISEKSLAEQEFKSSLIDSIEKSVEKEKQVLEVKLNESQVYVEKLRIENKLLKDELNSFSSLISNLESNLLLETKKHSAEITKLSSEIQYLNHKLKVSLKSEEIYASYIEKHKPEYNTNSEYTFTSSSNSNESLEVLRNQLIAKENFIKNLESQLTIRLSSKERSNSSISEKSVFSREITLFEQSQSELQKKLQQAYATISEKEEKLLSLRNEYNTKSPIIQKQKEDYENLIISHETLKAALEQANKSIKDLESNYKSISEELTKAVQEREFMERKSKVYCSQISNTLYSKRSGTDLIEFATIEQIIERNSNLSVRVNELEETVRKDQSIIKELQERPLIIEEVVENVHHQRYLALEIAFQDREKENNQLFASKKTLEIENQTLNFKFKTLESQNLQLHKTISDLQLENQSLKQKTNSASPVIIPAPQPSFNLKEFYESSLQEYKSEIERLTSHNNTMHEVLKQIQAQLIQSIDQNKQKINEVLNEKSSIYLKFKKLQHDHTLLQQVLSQKEKELTDSLESKKLSTLPIDPAEFAVIKELHSAQLTISTQKEEIENLSLQLDLLRSEKNRLYAKLDASQNTTDQELKSKLDESTQLYNIYKYNCELYEQEVLKLQKHIIELEEGLKRTQSELNDARDTQSSLEYRNDPGDAKGADLDLFEKKISELMEEIETKDNHILSLMSMHGVHQNLPEVMSKIVSVLYKASKVIKN
jgi:hypothetical protein